MRPLLRSFLADTRGVISVDYVVLAAGVLGASIFMSEAISGGMHTLAGDVDEEFRGEAQAEYMGETYTDDFSDGSPGWSGAEAWNVKGIGDVLGPIGGTGGSPAVSKDFTAYEDADAISFEFDVLAMDSLDNESGIIFIDGLEIGRLTSNMGDAKFQVAAGLDPDKYIIRQTTIDNNIDLGGNPNWKDHRSYFQVTVKDPNSVVNFGFGSTANQGTGDESFAIDNFRATGLAE